MPTTEDVKAAVSLKVMAGVEHDWRVGPGDDWRVSDFIVNSFGATYGVRKFQRRRLHTCAHCHATYLQTEDIEPGDEDDPVANWPDA